MHTPLMSGANAISGITVVGALILLKDSTAIPFMSPEMFAFAALVLATINVVGGFAVTNRMLNMIAGKRGGK